MKILQKISSTALFAAFAVTPAFAYGGGGGGGGASYSNPNLLPVISEISPRRDAVLSGVFEISFVVSGNPDEESIVVDVDGKSLPVEVTPLAGGDYSVSAVARNITSGNALVHIAASSRYSASSTRSYIYPIAVVNSQNLIDVERGENGVNEVVLFNPGVKHNLCGQREEVLNDTFHSAAVNFRDIESNPNKKYILDLANRCIVHGDGLDKSKFNPEKSFNRAAAVKTVIRGLGYNYKTSADQSPFADVLAQEWFTPYLVVAKKYRIVRGYNDGKFRPDNTMNIAEGLAIVARASHANISDFNTGDGVWFTPYVGWGVANGLIDAGTNPSAPLSRGALARMVAVL